MPVLLPDSPSLLVSCRTPSSLSRPPPFLVRSPPSVQHRALGRLHVARVQLLQQPRVRLAHHQLQPLHLGPRLVALWQFLWTSSLKLHFKIVWAMIGCLAYYPTLLQTGLPPGLWLQ